MKINTLSEFRFLMVIAATILAIHFTGGVYAAPPLPVHTIEGVGGGAITPMAYLVNPEPRCECSLLGKPAVALSWVNIGEKNLDAITITETLGGRIEFGYAANRLGLGSLPRDIRDATTVDIESSNMWLHHFNLRLLAVKENTCVGGFAMPAVTAGVHFKVNDGIRDIDQRLGGALSGIGYERENGVDFTLTATRTIPPEVLGRPLILTAGLRASQAAQLGFLGFGDEYHATFEGNVAYLPFDWLVLAYEFRQKPDPYGQIAGLIGDEDHWHAFDAIFILNEQTAFTAGYGAFGTVANTEENGVWWLQLKYEF
ncbi:MAG TPA: DUF3034 family protein [Thermoguttaceae bacterium]|nr:DUF3034 family protein [Thermoguttaceae bacterium]